MQCGNTARTERQFSIPHNDFRVYVYILFCITFTLPSRWNEGLEILLWHLFPTISFCRNMYVFEMLVSSFHSPTSAQAVWFMSIHICWHIHVQDTTGMWHSNLPQALLLQVLLTTTYSPPQHKELFYLLNNSYSLILIFIYHIQTLQLLLVSCK